MVAVPGILYALSQRGPDLSLEEFHEWYDEEHGPDRMRLSGFQTGRRYEATDGLLPRWAAVYELDDIAFLDSPEYMALINNRSDRERRVLSRLDVLDRHVYRLVYAKGQRANEAKTVLLTVCLACHPSDAMHIEKWYDEEHIDALAKIPGWLQSRLLVQEIPKEDDTVKYLAMHEFSEHNGLEGPEHKAAQSTPWRRQIMSTIVQSVPIRRIYCLYGTFPKPSTDRSK